MKLNWTLVRLELRTIGTTARCVTIVLHRLVSLNQYQGILYCNFWWGPKYFESADAGVGIFRGSNPGGSAEFLRCKFISLARDSDIEIADLKFLPPGESNPQPSDQKPNVLPLGQASWCLDWFEGYYIFFILARESDREFSDFKFLPPGDSNPQPSHQKPNALPLGQSSWCVDWFGWLIYFIFF